ncbi:MAG: hypothetical protein HY849_01065 [Nitrosomonadales bacterium]|nr:hypothetical protein [Nitrosomonadales bacterium]
MSIYTPDESALRQLAAEIEALPPRPHHAALLEVANRIRPGCGFRYALNRGGWYRPGGVIAADGTRLADNLEAWAQAELRACAGDIGELVERHADAGLLVTRHSGRTHYFVAAYGPAPAGFLQLEVEELQEVLDRQLIDPGSPPEDLQELTEPITPAVLDAQPVAAPRYRFRRLIDMRQTVAKLPGNAGLARLLYEWAHSSAAARGHFSDHWIVALREHQDRYRNAAVSISLVSRHARELKPFQWNQAASGVELASQLQSFDRAAGYPAAWYFHLVAGTITPPKIAYGIVRDLDAGFSYLPDSEVALVRGWVDAAYSV